MFHRLLTDVHRITTALNHTDSKALHPLSIASLFPKKQERTSELTLNSQRSSCRKSLQFLHKVTSSSHDSDHDSLLNRFSLIKLFKLISLFSQQLLSADSLSLTQNQNRLSFSGSLSQIASSYILHH